jgi:hypothetical protein
VLALVVTAGALADNPTVRIAKADQDGAVAALLRSTDFASGWQGGPTKPTKLTAPKCPGFDPKESDLVVTGHADARFVYPSGQASFDQDVQVLATAAAVRKDFARTIGPKLGPCLEHELKASSQVVAVRVQRIPFPRFGSVSAAYRATLVLKVGKHRVSLLADYVFFGVGRYEYALKVVAPAGERSQLVAFESAMARILVRRSPKPCC